MAYTNGTRYYVDWNNHHGMRVRFKSGPGYSNEVRIEGAFETDREAYVACNEHAIARAEHLVATGELQLAWLETELATLAREYSYTKPPARLPTDYQERTFDIEEMGWIDSYSRKLVRSAPVHAREEFVAQLRGIWLRSALPHVFRYNWFPTLQDAEAAVQGFEEKFTSKPQTARAAARAHKKLSWRFTPADEPWFQPRIDAIMASYPDND